MPDTDQVDVDSSQATPASGDVFDKLGAVHGDVFDRIAVLDKATKAWEAQNTEDNTPTMAQSALREGVRAGAGITELEGKAMMPLFMASDALANATGLPSGHYSDIPSNLAAARQELAPQSNEIPTVANQIGGVLGQQAVNLPLVLATGGAAAPAETLAPAIEQAPTILNAAKSLLPAAAYGVVAMQPSAALAAQDVMDQGGTTAQALTAQALTSAAGALPINVESSLATPLLRGLSRGAQATALAVPQSILLRQAQQVAEGKPVTAIDPFQDLAAAIPQIALGAVFGGKTEPKFNQAVMAEDANMPATAEALARQGLDNLSTTIKPQNEPTSQTSTPEQADAAVTQNETPDITGDTQAIQPAVSPDISGTQALPTSPLNTEAVNPPETPNELSSIQQPTDNTVPTQETQNSEVQNSNQQDATSQEIPQDQSSNEGQEEPQEDVLNVSESPSKDLLAPQPSENLQAVGQGNEPQEETAGARSGQEEAPIGQTPPNSSGEGAPDGVQVSHAALDQRRQKLGLPPILKQMRRGDAAVFDEAMRRIDADPLYPSKLIDELKLHPKALTAEEKAALAHEMAARELDFDQAHDEINNAKTDEERTDAKVSKNVALQKLNDVRDVLHKSGGSEVGRSLRYSQVILDNDKFTRARMEARISAEINDGKPLNPEQEKGVDDILKERKSIDEDEEKSRQKFINDKFSELFKNLTERTPRDIRSQKKKGDSLLDILNRKGEESAAALKDIKRQGRSLAAPGLDPDVLYHTAIVGAKHLANGIVDLGKFTTRMVNEFGDWVKPHIEPIYDRAKQYLQYATKEYRDGKSSIPKDQQSPSQLLEGYTDRDAIDFNLVGNLVRAHIRAGIEGKDNVMKAVQNDLKQFHPDITQREVEDAFSDYGKVRLPSQDPVRVKAAEYRRMSQLSSAIEDAKNGIPPKKSGQQRNKPTQSIREMETELKGLMKKYNIEPTSSEDQLKNSLQATKTRLSNQIEDLTKQIEVGERIPKEQRSVQYDDEANALKRDRDELQGILDKIHGPSELTDEQRLSIADKALDRTRDRLDKELQGIKEDVKKKKQVTSPELERKKAEIAAMRDLKRENEAALNPKKSPEQIAHEAAEKAVDKAIARYQEMAESGNLSPAERAKKFTPSDQLETKQSLANAYRDLIHEMRKDQLPRTPKDQLARKQALKALEKSKAEIDRQIQEEDFSTKPKKEGLASKFADVQKGRAERDAMRKFRDQLKKAATTTRSPEEIRLARYKAHIDRTSKELERRIKEEDYTKKKAPEPLVLDKDAENRLLRRKNLNEKYEKQFALHQLSKRGKLQRNLDLANKVYRAILLSGHTVLVKLTSAAVARLALNPLEQTVGSVLNKLPYVREVAKNSPFEGVGFKTSTELKTIRNAAIKGFSDAYQTLRTGKSNLSRMYGENPEHIPRDIWDIPSSLHGAIKAPVVRASYTRSFDKMLNYYNSKGIDTTDPLVLSKIHTASYKYALRDIFMQDNGAVKRFNGYVKQLETPDKNDNVSERKLVKAAALKAAFPIVKIGANVISEALDYAFGLPKGAWGAREAFKNGIENLAPDEADTILRQLKKGLVGNAAIALGFFAPSFFGGFYQEGKKKKPGEPAFNTIDVPTPAGKLNVPQVALHNPLFMVAQMGATIRKIADSRVNMNTTEKVGYGPATMSALLGLVTEFPFLKTAGMATEAAANPTRAREIEGRYASSLVPSSLQWIAQHYDKGYNGQPVQRNPKSPLDYIKAGIPGLREQVPAKLQ